MKNIRIFLSENFHFLEMKFSIYLNMRVFVMSLPRLSLNLFLSISLPVNVSKYCLVCGKQCRRYTASVRRCLASALFATYQAILSASELDLRCFLDMSVRILIVNKVPIRIYKTQEILT